MDKQQAEQLVLSQFRALPPAERRTLDQVLTFAETATSAISFETLGNPRTIIRAWVVREFQGGNIAGAVAKRTTTGRPLRVVR